MQKAASMGSAFAGSRFFQLLLILYGSQCLILPECEAISTAGRLIQSLINNAHFDTNIFSNFERQADSEVDGMGLRPSVIWRRYDLDHISDHS